MRKPKKTRKPDFSPVGLNWGFKVDTCGFPKLEIHATAIWFGDTYKVPNYDILTAGITKTIEQAFVARSAK